MTKKRGKSTEVCMIKSKGFFMLIFFKHCGGGGHKHVSAGAHEVQKRADSPGAAVPCGYEPPDMAAGKHVGPLTLNHGLSCLSSSPSC